jgi:hypothetical protein
MQRKEQEGTGGTTRDSEEGSKEEPREGLEFVNITKFHEISINSPKFPEIPELIM